MAFATETDLRYPIGKFERPASLTDDQRSASIAQIEEAPAKLRAAVAGLNDQQLDTPYRPGGWTVRQLVHHVPDSHMNAFTRFKLALTEEVPTIKPYLEARWAELADAKSPIAPSLDLLDALHKRWVVLLRSLAPADWQREFLHPEHNRKISLDQNVALYSCTAATTSHTSPLCANANPGGSFLDLIWLVDICVECGGLPPLYRPACWGGSWRKRSLAGSGLHKSFFLNTA